MCDELNVNTLFTYAGVHMGLGMPIIKFSDQLNGRLNKLYSEAVYSNAMTKVSAGPVGLWRTWWDLDAFYQKSTFLPYINNEIEGSYF